jgi:chromosome partitioning protein
MKVLNFYSVKGGTGKSSLSLLSGKFLASKGKKTLILDLDPQRSISKSLGKPNEETTAYQWLLGDSSLRKVFKLRKPENLFLLPGSLKLLKISESVNQNFIQEEIESLNDFDFVIIDNQPSWNSIVRTGIQASHKVIIPSLLSLFDLEEVSFAIEEARKLKKGIEIGVILNRVLKVDKPTNEEKEYLEMFKDDFKGTLLSSMIPNSNLVRKSIDRQEDFLTGKTDTKKKFSKIVHSFLEEITGEGFQPTLFGGN